MWVETELFIQQTLCYATAPFRLLATDFSALSWITAGLCRDIVSYINIVNTSIIAKSANLQIYKHFDLYLFMYLLVYPLIAIVILCLLTYYVIRTDQQAKKGVTIMFFTYAQA
jgi:hypothetical protein